jgi:hypothetical protein
MKRDLWLGKAGWRRSEFDKRDWQEGGRRPGFCRIISKLRARCASLPCLPRALRESAPSSVGRALSIERVCTIVLS